MSATTVQQATNNGKKSSSSSAGNTPASTPVTNGNSMSQSTPPPPNNNAPKYGTLVPNRIFVGGISASTTEGELLQLFSTYGTVKAAKIIQDRAGVSKGYGFITFESEDDAKRPLKDADNIVLKERKLNIAPAIKKQFFNFQPFNRAFDASSPPAVAPGNPAQYFFPPNPGVPYFQGGVAYYTPPPPAAPGDPNSQPTTMYQPPPVYPGQTGPPQPPTYPSMMFPQAVYMPQQYPMPMPYEFNYYNNGAPPYMVSSSGGHHSQQQQQQQQNGGATSSSNGGGNNNGQQQGPPTSMSQSNSPPRPVQMPPPPPCYNPQLHYGSDSVFYNVPVYGAPIDATGAVYENMEMPPGVSCNGYGEISGQPQLRAGNAGNGNGNSSSCYGTGGGGGSGSVAGSQARRSKRAARSRNVVQSGNMAAGGAVAPSPGGGTSLSEIGAGDAPLPVAPQPQSGGDAVSDACKKMEALKL